MGVGSSAASTKQLTLQPDPICVCSISRSSVSNIELSFLINNCVSSTHTFIFLCCLGLIVQFGQATVQG